MANGNPFGRWRAGHTLKCPFFEDYMEQDYPYLNECECCYALWYDSAQHKFCKYCTDNPILLESAGRKKRLDRMIDVLQTQKMNRIQDVLKMIVKEIRE